jgi:molybdopterin converting factor small subunit
VATIEVRYFASLREAAGRSVQSVQTEAPTLKELYDQLRAEHDFSLAPQHVKASVNGDWSGLDGILADGDSVVFIPPVAGG